MSSSFFCRLGVFKPVYAGCVHAVFLPGGKDAVSWRPISLLFHREKITHERDVQSYISDVFLSGYHKFFLEPKLL